MARNRPDSFDPEQHVLLSTVARRTETDPRFWRTEIAVGNLPAYRLGDRWLRVRWGDVVALLEARRVTPRAAARRAAIEERVADVIGREETVKHP